MVQIEFWEIFVEFWVSFWSPGAPQKGKICFQVFCLCLEGPRSPFGCDFEVILVSFWVLLLMFFGDVSGLFSGCPDLLGFCFWGAFSRDSLGFSRDSPGILDGSSRDSPGIL